VCGYTIARIVAEVEDIIQACKMAKEYREKGEVIFERGAVDLMEILNFPALDVLINNIKVTCPGAYERGIKYISEAVERTKKNLEDRDYDRAIASISDVKYLWVTVRKT